MRSIIAIVALISCSVFTNLTYAQMAPAEQSTTQYVTNKPITPYPVNERISGSPYEDEDFANGKIMKNGKILATNVALRFNALKDEMEVKSSVEDHNRTGRVMVKSPDVYAKIMNKTFVYLPKQEGLDKAGYFVVVYEGDKYDLLKKINKEYIDGAESMTGMTRDIPAMYKQKEVNYLLNKQTSKIAAFPNSRSGRLNLFGQKKKEMKRYAAEKKININKKHALVKMVKYFDTL
ncbi:MAG: hypothetical protein HKN48_00890 [Flavobacteriaceae bacterium]|nr:hypothetical protein [Flavobacteriaceae bacterium]